MTQYETMGKDERTAFAGLVRLMTRMDGVLSPEEVLAVSALARELGAPELWSLMNDSTFLERADLVVLIDGVGVESRQWIYDVLSQIADSDGIDASERELLDWLECRWDLSGERLAFGE